MKALYHENSTLFQQAVAYSPISCAINKVQNLHWVFANKSLLDLLRLDPDLMLSQGFSYTRKLIHPHNLPYQLQVLAEYAASGPSDIPLNYFQYCRPYSTHQYIWIYTQKIFLTDTLYLSFYQDLSQLNGLYQFIQPYLHELLKDPLCYQKYTLLTSR